MSVAATATGKAPVLFLIYLIAPPGSLRHSLFVLLTALGRGEPIHQYDAIDVALEQPPAESPDLTVLTAAAPGDDLAEELMQIQIHWPQSRIVALIDDEAYARANPSICNVTVVPAGTAAARLRAIFNDLLRTV